MRRDWEPQDWGGKGRGSGPWLEGADGTEAGNRPGETAAAKGNEETGRRRRKAEGGTAGGGRDQAGRRPAGAPGRRGRERRLLLNQRWPGAAMAEPVRACAPSPGGVDALAATPPGLAQTWAASAARGPSWPGAPAIVTPAPLSRPPETLLPCP